jgi:hypothetical protein
MANDFLSLPTGLTEADYPSGSLLDYTPPAAVPWQAPLMQLGENIFENYAKTQVDRSAAGDPRLLTQYNRRLSRPSGTGGALPTDSEGRPISLAEFGRMHWEDFGQADPETQLSAVPGALYPFSAAGGTRNPYIAYSGDPAGEGVSIVQGRLPQPTVSGYEYAYPVFSRYAHPSGLYGGEERYQAGRVGSPFKEYYTQDIEKYPYFPYLPADLAGGTEYQDAPYILVGQSLVPAGDRSDIFSY